MKDSSNNHVSLAAKANAAFEEVALEVIAQARFYNVPIVVWRDGKVTKLSPDQVERELAERAISKKPSTE